jgi:putative ABC transport system ATP-binding protein
VADALIRVVDLKKSYPLGDVTVHALRGVTLDVAAGTFLAVIGASGSGKSTFMNIIGLLDRPTAGQYFLEGGDVSGFDRDRRAILRNKKIGFVFQNFNLLPRTTALENVELPLLLTRLGKAERRERALTALRVVGLADRSSHYPRQLSGGQEQRVAIARAIVGDPSVLVADEPTGDLDAKSAEEILALLESLNRDFHKTIVMVTHDPRAAERAHVQRHLDKGVLKD